MSKGLPAMREAVWRVDGELAITATGTLEHSIAESASEERYRTLLMTTFAFLATVLAAVGIGGLTARQVARQTRELGIRKALGARDGDLVRSAFRPVGPAGSERWGFGSLWGPTQARSSGWWCAGPWPLSWWGASSVWPWPHSWPVSSASSW
jgi:hypothetical protein